MTTTCPHCGGLLIPGQPLCTDCGKAIDEPVASGKEKAASSLAKAEGSQAASGAGKVVAVSKPPSTSTADRRDKQRDFALIGRVIADKYKVLDVLGQGGFGTVYLVEITAGMVGEKLALKLIPEQLSSDLVIRDQFLNEIRVAMRMVDKYIVQIRDVGTTEEGLLYYTMDYCSGSTLGEVLRREGKIAIPRALLIFMKVLRALQTAHAVGIVHRDLKPANVMVQSQGGKESVRVLDFGIATAVRATAPVRQKGFVGSPYYMPPEQFLGEKLGFYTDIYSVGVMLYECVTGSKPYTGSTAQEVFQNLKRGGVPLPETLTPEVADYPKLSALIMKALERNPERRLQTAKEFFEALNAVLVGTATGGLEGAGAVAVAGPDQVARSSGAPVLSAETAAATAPPLPGAREAAARIRRRRSAAAESRPRYAGAVALGTFIVAVTVMGILFQKEIGGWFAPRGGGVGTALSPEAAEQASARQGTEKTAAEKKLPPDRGEEKPSQNGTASETASLSYEKEAAEAKFAAWIEQSAAELEAHGKKAEWPELAAKAEAVLRQAPDNVAALRWLGIAAFHEESFERAEEMLAKARAAAAARNESLGPDALLVLARARLRLSKPRLREAEEVVIEALGPNRKNAEAILLWAQILETSGRLVELKKLHGASQKGGVTSPELEKLWQRVLVEKPRQAREEAGRLLDEARKAFAARNHQGALDLAAQAADRAAQCELGALASEAELLAAECHLELGKPEACLKLLDLARENLAKRREAQAAEGTDAGEAGKAGSSGPTAAAGAEAAMPPEAVPRETVTILEARIGYLRGRGRLLEFETSGKKEARDEALIAFDLALSKVKDLDKKTVEPFVAAVRLWRARIHASRGDVELVAEDMKPTRDRTEPALIEQQVRTYFLAAQKAEKKEARVLAFETAMGRLLTLLKLQGLPPEIEKEGQLLLGQCYVNLGTLQNRNTYYPQAVNRFLYAERAGLATTELYEAWALAYERMSQLNRAAEKYQRVYELKPTAFNCLRAADYYIKSNPRSSEGLKLLQDGIERFPDDQALKSRYLEVTKPSKS